MQLPATSTEYLHVPVTATPEGTDLEDAPVQVAVVAHRANPASDEWRTATWDDGVARILVGPGTDTELTAGDYHVWINIDPAGSENIVRRAGVLAIT
ncbi:hypothetical protein [Streptomyces europaeiscabiei]|uniref:hypothetical protein n=1 Tax=Streptomyces europaeiscabiei TaxID=146819 RepID=UPI0029A693BB|nr:hypothetical protein [Streptomyces europaeiscabiei]MDX3839570.1 hypothetical protein [Streptomyces europaeiscabiei]